MVLGGPIVEGGIVNIVLKLGKNQQQMHFAKFLTAFIIWHPFTVKLLSGSASPMLGSGLCLNPSNDPSSSSTKYL
jgi:hypothetical protein